MLFRAAIAAGFVAAVVAALVISQISDGQVQAPTAYPISQVSDGQIQAPPRATENVATTTAVSTDSYPLPYSYNQVPSVNSAAVSSAAAYAGIPVSDLPGATDPVPPVQLSIIGNNVTGFDCSASISQNRTIPLSYPGRKVFLEWENPGKAIGPNNSYITDTKAGAPEWVVWVTQQNVTYSPLTNVSASDGMNYGMTIQPDVSTNEGNPAINGTMFIALTDTNQTCTAFNLSAINPQVAAGPFLYQAG